MSKINIIEVGPRDGLQNVKEFLSFDQKKNLIQALINCGFKDIEAGAFVRADKVPAMADSDKIADHFKSKKLWYLTPNLKGLEVALSHQVEQLAFFTASSDVFNQKNIGMTVDQSITNIEQMIDYVKNLGKKPKLRLYISTVIASPFEGKVTPDKTVKLIEKLFPLGFDQISLGDTIGVGVPHDWKALLSAINTFDSNLIKQNKVALHCHNTYGTALTCVAKGLEMGITSFDSSIGGLGGCPYAPGATGNLATEDLVYFCQQEGLDTGIKLDDLMPIFDSTRTGTLCNVSSVYRAKKQSI